ncbi:MAG: hypothetical protein FWE79_01790, partial [Firmicutes bacterium]|nr:hypothetical protein [Bacillota bacterium]
EIRTPLEGLIHDSRSPFFINNKSVTSNSECGGDNIVIGKDVGYSKKDKEILKAHGFDPQNCVLPKELEDISKRIMKGCAKFLGIVAGFDFILNNADKKWYFLEVGGNPTPHDYSLVHGLGYSPTDNTIKNVTKSVQIDLKVRTEALAEMIYQRKESLKKKQAKKKPTEVTA